MPAPLALIAAYAYSAKKKGDRQRAAATAKAEADAAAKEAENMRGTLFQLPNNGGFMTVEDGDSVGLGRAQMMGAVPMKYGPMKNLSMEFKGRTDYYEDKNGKTGPLSEWSLEDQLTAGLVKLGQTDIHGIVHYDPQHIVDARRGNTDITSSSKRMVEALHPLLPNKVYTGAPETVIGALNQAGISLTDDRLLGNSWIETTDKNGTKITNFKEYDFGTAPSTEAKTDIRYHLLDGSKVMSSEIGDERVIKDAEIDFYEYGKYGDDGKFNPTSRGSPSGTRDAKTSMEEALKASGSTYMYKVSDDIIIVTDNKASNQERVTSFANQLAAAEAKESGSIAKFKAAYDSGNVGAVSAVNGIYRDLLAEYDSFEVGPNGQMLRRYDMSMSFKHMLERNYGDVIQIIPGLLAKAEALDNDRRENKRIELDQQANTETTSAKTIIVTGNPPAEEAAGNPEVPEEVEIPITVTWPSRFNTLVNDSLIPLIASRQVNPVDVTGQPISPEDAATAIVGQYVMYEKSVLDTFERDERGNKIPLDDQPILDAFEKLRTRVIPGTNTNLLDHLIFSIADPTKSKVDQLDQSGQEVAEIIALATDGDMQLATQIIAPLLVSGKGAKIAMNNKFGFGQSQAKALDFRRDQAAVNAASRRGISVVNAALSTYYGPDGELLDSTAVANLYLGFEGVQYWAGKAADLVGIDFTDSDAVLEQGRKYITQARINLKRSGNLEESQDALNAMEKDLQDIAKRGATNAKYAQREFFTLVLAYEVAAAIQGGTGGRTISDQDVALIFRGLRQRFTDAPQAQVAALQGVKAMLTRFEHRSGMLMADAKSQAAYLTAENLLFAAGFDTNPYYTTDYVVDEFGPQAGSGKKKPPADPFFGMKEDDYNAGLLDRINKQNLTGGNYSTLDEAKLAQPKFFESQKRAYDAQLQNQQKKQGSQT
tara:strand:+ start:2355 stop:5159 length:2805 start_codon:yes stop_codon:yes gene_type:complete